MLIAMPAAATRMYSVSERNFHTESKQFSLSGCGRCPKLAIGSTAAKTTGNTIGKQVPNTTPSGFRQADRGRTSMAPR